MKLYSNQHIERLEYKETYKMISELIEDIFYKSSEDVSKRQFKEKIKDILQMKSRYNK